MAPARASASAVPAQVAAEPTTAWVAVSITQSGRRSALPGRWVTTANRPSGVTATSVEWPPKTSTTATVRKPGTARTWTRSLPSLTAYATVPSGVNASRPLLTRPASGNLTSCVAVSIACGVPSSSSTCTVSPAGVTVSVDGNELPGIRSVTVPVAVSSTLTVPRSAGSASS